MKSISKTLKVTSKFIGGILIILFTVGILISIVLKSSGAYPSGGPRIIASMITLVYLIYSFVPFKTLYANLAHFIFYLIISLSSLGLIGSQLLEEYSDVNYNLEESLYFIIAYFVICFSFIANLSGIKHMFRDN